MQNEADDEEFADVDDEHLAMSARNLIRRVKKLVDSQLMVAGDSSRNKIKPVIPSLTGDDTWPDRRDGPATFLGLEPGSQIGRFEIRRMLGSGGFGIVLLAYDSQLDREVALKVPRLDALASTDGRSRFLREARAAAMLGHPNIVPVFEAGQIGPVLYIAFEYVEGTNLSTWLEEITKPVDQMVAARLMAALATAVQHAHSRGIIHRDLKPANILLQKAATSCAADGDALEYCARISDFGMARVNKDDGLNTQTGAMVGTPAYMSPEQIHQGANSIGPATDVYGLGAILYELLTGRPPFVGASVAAIIHSVAKNDPVAPRRIRPNVARDLEAICLKCLEKDPRRRYESASALVEELERFIAGKPIQARQIRLWEQAIRWTRRHPAPTALIAMFFFGTMTVCWQWYRAETHRVDAERQTIAAVAAREAEREERNRVEHSLYARNITLAQHEYESNYTTRARQLLAETPEHLRNWEYDYLFQTVHSEMYDFAEFNLPVLAVAVSPNGKCAAASCALWGNNVDCETRVWDINTGMLRFVLTGHSSSVMDVDFSPDSRYIATAGNVWRASQNSVGKVILWDAESGEMVRELSQDRFFSIEFEPSGQYLFAGKDNGNTLMLRIEDGSLVRTFQGHRGSILDVSLHPSGEFLATASRDGSCKIWDVATGNQVFGVSGLVDVRSVDFSPSGKEFALATFNGDVKVYGREGDSYRHFAAHEQQNVLRQIRYSPDGQYLAISVLGQGVRLIHPYTGKPVRAFSGHNGDPRSVAFSRDGQMLLTGGIDGRVKVWDLVKTVDPQSTVRVGPYFVDAMPIPNSRLIATAESLNTDRPLRPSKPMAWLWDVDSQQFVRSFAGHDDWLTSIDVSSSGKSIASGSNDRTICVWNLESAELLIRLAGHNGAVRDVAYLDEDRKLVSCSDDSTVRLWNLTNGKPLQVWNLPGETPIRALAIPASELVAIGTAEGRVHVRRWSDGADLGSHQTVAPTKCLAASPCGKHLILGNGSFELELLSVEEMRHGNPSLLKTMSGHTDVLSGVAFSADGERIVSVGGDHCVKVWETETGQEVLRLVHDQILSNSVVGFDGTGESIVVASNSMLCSWNLRSGISEHVTATEASNRNQQVLDWHQAELRIAQGEAHSFATCHHLEKLLLSDPGNSDWLIRHARSEAGMGEYSVALDKFALFCANKPDLATFYFCGLLALQEGKTELYQEACKKSLTHFSEKCSLSEINSIAWTCALTAEAGVDLEKIEYAMIAGVVGQESNYLNTLGAVCYRRGNYEQAVNYLDQSLASLDLAGPWFDWIFLALAHEKMGHHELADQFRNKFKLWWIQNQPLSEFDQFNDNRLTMEVRLELTLLANELLGDQERGIVTQSLP